MSVVERALRNLKKSATGKEDAEPRPTIARVSRGPMADDATSPPKSRLRVDPTRSVEFNLEALRQAGLYATGNQRLAEEYRLIKRPLLKTAATGHESGQKNPNLLMIASALPGEGKTFTSVNLSMSLASEKDWSVLLVDVDCRNPQLSRLLGVADEPGLLDLLRDPDKTLDELALGTNIRNLSVLPLGTPGEDAAELLGSARMSDFCTALSAQVRQLVVFDSSPLLLTTEPVVLSSQIGQAVVVVSAYKTPRQTVEEAVEKLDDSLAIGLVLNRINGEEHSLRYGGYGYGRYPYQGSAE